MAFRLLIDYSQLVESGYTRSWLYIPAGFGTVKQVIKHCLEKLGLHYDASSILPVMSKGLVPLSEPAVILHDGDQLKFWPAENSESKKASAANTISRTMNGTKRPRSQAGSDSKPPRKVARRAVSSDDDLSSESSSATSESSSSSSDSDRRSDLGNEVLIHSAETNSKLPSLVTETPTSPQAWKKTRRGKRAGRKHRKSSSALASVDEEAAGDSKPASKASMNPKDFLSLDGGWEEVVLPVLQLAEGAIVRFRHLHLTSAMTPEESKDILARVKSFSSEEMTIQPLTEFAGSIAAPEGEEYPVETTSITRLARLLPLGEYTPTSPVMTPAAAPVEPPPAPAWPPADNTVEEISSSKSKKDQRSAVLRRRLGVGSLLKSLTAGATQATS